MKNYVFVCIGTNKLVEDSFGPRVGDILSKSFCKNENVDVLGTMKSPIHFQNAPIFLDYLKHEKSNVILIDSALGEVENIGNTYINLGGIEIGKAFGKSFYFPAHINIKTVVGTRKNIMHELVNNKQILTEKQIKITYINKLADNLAKQIINGIYEK